MTKILNSLHTVENNLDSKLEVFLAHHPLLFYFMIFIGMPIGILVAVTIFSTIIMLPISLIFGWI